MRALSLTQPWAWLVVHGGKRIENRRWHLPRFLAGETVLIHAAKGMRLADYDGARAMADDIGVTVPARGDLERGGIIGRARFVTCLCPTLRETEIGRSALDRLVERCRVETGQALDLRWWMEGQHGFVLSRVEPLPFRPWKGALGFFRVPEVE